ncbi:uncharacterized protein LOC133845376 [Drosophila sulfurigaster albostrigata]|uniref:uncharacterized protein LOC133845376 n=1 Tax=Drosophila sulfurigaster albostrigata TaxID=89887 RepID=UPI002D21D261|nr:uncharacterized protein LOC133845376 [Drosophila sulfurigaster albostrigata]
MLVLFAVAIGVLSFTNAHRYNLEFEDDELFSDCSNQPESVLNIHGLFNLTEWTIERPQDNLKCSGNFTTVWNIQKTDRIQASLDLFRYERREWVPTLYRIKTPHLCSILFDKNQYWYPIWIQHVTNIEEVKDKCLNVPGTKYIHETFDMHLEIENKMGNIDGQHKLQFELKAFDQFERMRPTSICFAMIINYVRLSQKSRK